jgi:hypothetical protein
MTDHFPDDNVLPGWRIDGECEEERHHIQNHKDSSAPLPGAAADCRFALFVWVRANSDFAVVKRIRINKRTANISANKFRRIVYGTDSVEDRPCGPAA